MYGTKPMSVIRRGMNARKSAQKKATHLSWKNAIREGIVKIITLISILVVVSSYYSSVTMV